MRGIKSEEMQQGIILIIIGILWLTLLGCAEAEARRIQQDRNTAIILNGATR